ncbi:unnamed protein product [Rotaria sordida]|uniref:Uncharacterized protein n=1 Tax=Rotaria sordida TaxID=392033 RepID=A0A814H032_9BILA|nr:unnamed protein product [Rotaria sordida]
MDTGAILSYFNANDGFSSSSLFFIRFIQFYRKFCDKLDLDINDIAIKQIQSGSAILEVEIYNRLESNDKKLRLKMIHHKLTDKLKSKLAKMKISFVFMNPIKSLFKIQKYRSEIKLNPRYNRVYTPGYDYWDGALND